MSNFFDRWLIDSLLPVGDDVHDEWIEMLALAVW